MSIRFMRIKKRGCIDEISSLTFNRTQSRGRHGGRDRRVRASSMRGSSARQAWSRAVGSRRPEWTSQDANGRSLTTIISMANDGGPSGSNGSTSSWKRKAFSALGRHSGVVISGVIVAVLTVILTQAISQCGAKDPKNPTAVLTKTVFSEGKLLAAFKVTRREQGERCLSFSVSSEDPEARRCFGEKFIGDPCWPRRRIDGDFAVCLSSPWSSSVTMLTRVRSFDTGDTPSPQSRPVKPWALEIRNPNDESEILHCTFQTGVEFTVGGQRRNWKCVHADPDNGKIEGYALGTPDSSQSIWTVQFSGVATEEVKDAEIVRVWR